MRPRALPAIASCLAIAACVIEPPLTPAPPLAPPLDPSPISAVVTGSVDALGPKPTLGVPVAFEPPVPEVFTLPSGMTVWLVERHALPMVSVTLAVPSGAAADPPEKPGLAFVTADMLDEGAGSRSALELSSAVNDLGASLGLGATADGSFASLTVLKKNLGPAFGLLADVVARPRFEPKEWKRVHDLWANDLKKRADDPSAVSGVVCAAAVSGLGTPYGHPVEGLAAAAERTDLGAVKAFYAAHWRPDVTVLVVAGDVTKAELVAMAASSLADWKPRAAEAPARALPPSLPAERPRLVLVDRKDAPQSVIAVARDGVAASDPTAPLLALVNVALGGSFTSRLNQNLREDHGWSYGARSSFAESRSPGLFVARAAVRTDATGLALKEMLAELDKMADQGLTDAELAKVRAHDRAELVQSYETTSGVAHRLGTLALLGLPPGFDAVASRARQAASVVELGRLAHAHVDAKAATIVVVGPRALVEPQLAAIGLGPAAIWDAEGAELSAPKKTPAAAPGKKEPAPSAPKKAAPAAKK